MPASKNLDGTITVSGTFQITDANTLALQQAEAAQFAGQPAANIKLIRAEPSNHQGNTFTHTSWWKVE